MSSAPVWVRRARAFCSAMLAFGIAAGVHAQDAAPRASERPRSDAFCLRGGASQHCELLLISEAGLYKRLLRPTQLRVVNRGPGFPPDSNAVRVAGGVLSFELGALASVGNRSGLGATFVLAVESDNLAERGITGVKGRYRYWLTKQGLALDLGAGVESRPMPRFNSEPQATGITADIAINHRDIISAVVRYDQLRLNGKTKPEISLGARLNGKAGGFTTAGILLTFATLYGLFVLGYSEAT